MGIDQLAAEMATAKFGDARLSQRLGRIVGAIAKAPGKSLPKALVTDAALEATYRFMSNSAVTPEGILAPYIAATCDRLSEAHVVLAIQDTTECEFKGESRTGLGRLSERRQGFHAHVCLAVKADDGMPLGLLGLRTWRRPAVPPGRKKRATYQYKMRQAKESDRWCDLSAEVEELARSRTKVVHVMDREADFYRLEAQLVDAGADFVIRGNHLGRRLADGRTLACASEDVVASVSREVELSKRPATRNKTAHAPRRTRIAQLRVGATRVTLQRSWATPAATGSSFDLNVVHVWEPEAPEGENPVEWTLLTTLPIDTAAQVEFVVDIYRRRWMIEELFKALKTGCRLEHLQLESAEALVNALAVMLPVAVGLLALRGIARTRPDASARQVLTPLQRKLLSLHEHTRRLPLETARDALLAVARLGGHIKNNGDPGWLVLGRGFEDLLVLEAGAKIALEM